MDNNFVPVVFLSEKFGELRVIENDDKLYFCGTDVAKALGYSNPRDAVGRHCKQNGVVKRDTISTHATRGNGVAQQTVSVPYITEGNVYRLIARSKLKEAVQFEEWVFDEILPAIRKTGGYVNNAEQFVDNYFPNSSKEVRAQLIQMLEIVKKQDSIIGAQMPSVEFTRAVVKSGENITIGDFAKVLEAMQAAGFEQESADVSRIADQTVTLDNEKANKVLKIVDRLEELDDVQQVSTNLDLPEDFQEEE